MDASELGPYGLFVLMTIVGMELTVDDFRRVVAAPRAVIGGTLGQLLLLPLMTWGLVVGLGLAPIFGAGAVLVAVSPGAGISNVLAAVARANVALSVTLTAFASVLAVLRSIPGYVEAFDAAFPEDEPSLSYDNLATAIGAFERNLMTPGRFDDFLGGEVSVHFLHVRILVVQRAFIVPGTRGAPQHLAQRAEPFRSFLRRL